jgi:hypothetical protein
MMQVLLMQVDADTHLNAVTTIAVGLGPTTAHSQPFVGSFYHTDLQLRTTIEFPLTENNHHDAFSTSPY